MRFSVTVGAAGRGRDPKGLAEFARLAEDSGWDAMFLEDYVCYQDTDLPTYDPWISMAAMACATSTIRLGTTVTPVPRRRPWKLASEAVSLDQLSGGRLILGVGSGDVNGPDFQATGDGGTRRELAARLDEGLAIIDALWTGEPTSFRGKHYNLEGLRLPAVPVQKPRIPIWIGGDLRIPKVRTRMARWDGACGYADGGITADDVRKLLAEVPDPARYDIKIGTSSPLDRVPELAEAGATWWGQWIPPGDDAETHAVIRSGPPSW